MVLELFLDEIPPDEYVINSEALREFFHNHKENRIVLYTTNRDRGDWDRIVESWAELIRTSLDFGPNRATEWKLMARLQKVKELTSTDDQFIHYMDRDPKHLLKAVIRAIDDSSVFERAGDLANRIRIYSSGSSNLVVSDRYLLKCTGLLLERADDRRSATYRSKWNDSELSSLSNNIQFLINSMDEQVSKLSIHSEMSQYTDWTRSILQWKGDDGEPIYSRSTAKEAWDKWISAQAKRRVCLRRLFEQIFGKIRIDRAITVEVHDHTAMNWGEGLDHDRYLRPSMACYISSAGFDIIDAVSDFDSDDWKERELEKKTFLLRVDGRNISDDSAHRVKAFSKRFR
jgi:hypothetical protein